MTKSMTSGKPVKLILLFALPLIVGNIFQQFYSMADTVIVGRTIGVNALAAVGCTGSVSFFILGFVMGFTSGLSILIAQRFGAEDEEGNPLQLCCRYHSKYCTHNCDDIICSGTGSSCHGIFADTGGNP